MTILRKKRAWLTLALALLLLAAAAFWLSGVFERYQAFRTPEQQKEYMLEQIESAQGEDRFERIFRSAIESYVYEPYTFDVHAGPNSSVRGSGEDEFGMLTPQERLPLLEQYVRGAAPGPELIRAAGQLAYEYDALGRPADADRMLAAAEPRLGEQSAERQDLLLLRAERELDRGRAESAGPLLEQQRSLAGPKAEMSNRQAGWLASRLAFAEQQPEQAVRAASRTLDLDAKLQGQASPEDPAYAAYPTLEPYRALLEAAIRRGDYAPASFAGTLLRSDGRPVSRAGVFLRSPANTDSGSVPPPYRAVTDPNGRFEIPYLVPGFYRLELGLDYDQLNGWGVPESEDDWIEIRGGASVEHELMLQPLIKREAPAGGQELTGDTVEFRWSPVEGAAYYELIGLVPNSEHNGYTGTTIRTHIPGNKLTLPISDLQATPGALSWGEDGKWEQTDPTSRLAYLNPDEPFSWDVRAYDKAGRMLTQAYGYRGEAEEAGDSFDFYLKQRKLTPADRLLLDGKLPQALDAYRGSVQADPSDTDSLRMLTRLLDAKLQIEGDEAARAELIPLLERLIEADAGVSPQEVKQLSDLLYAEGDWERYDRYDALYGKLNGGTDAQDRSRQAASLLYRGHTDQAITAFEATMRSDSSHTFVGLYLAAQLMTQKPWADVLELAQRYPDLDQGEEAYRWEKLLNDMDAERSGRAEAFDQQLRSSLSALMDSRAAGLNSATSAAPAASGFASIDAYIETVSNAE